MIASRAKHRIGAKPAVFVFSLACLLPTARAQDKLDRELDFVLAMARDMRFIELAKEETDRLASEFRGAGDQDRIAQASVEIAYLGARVRTNRALQRQLFKEALDRSKELVERSGNPSVQQKARMTLADASVDFGQFLTEDLEIARESEPERVKDIETEAAGVFRAGIEACGKVMEALQPLRKDERQNTNYMLQWLRRGVLKRENGRAVKAERDVLVQQAVSDLSDLVLEAGEETAIGLKGLYEIGQCYEVLGDTKQALDSYKTTVGQITTALEQASELGLSGEMQAILFEMMQEITARTAEVMVRTGNPGAGELFTNFRAAITKFGEKGDIFDVVDVRFGHQVLLAECRFLAESGDSKKVAEAMTMAQRINDRHPNDFTGVKAKAVLRDILSVQQSLVSAKLLFEVGKGELQNKNQEAAVKNLRKAIAVLTPEETATIALDAYEQLGRAFGTSDRGLEAVIALTEGLKRHGGTDQNKASNVADVLDAAVAQLRRNTKNDAALEGLLRAATDQIGKYGLNSGAKLFWKAGNDLFNQKKYPEAVAEYQKIKPDFPFHELAQVNIARAFQQVGNFAEARKALAAFRTLAETKLDPKDPKAAYRSQAVASAEFLEAQLAYVEARGSEEFNLAKDPKKYPAAIEKLRAFVTNFEKDGENNVPQALESLGRLHCDLGELEQAETVYVQVKAKEAPRASRLATEIFREYQARAKSLVEELNQAIAKDKGEAAIAQAQKAVDDVRKKLTALGLDYINNSTAPQLGILVNTMLGFEQLKDWKRVEEIANKTLQLFGEDKTEATKRVVDLTVRPKIGEALLQQKKFQLAYDMLLAAEQESEKAGTKLWEVKRQIARALGGWFEFNNVGAPVREPGLDKPVEAYLKHFTEYRQWAERPEVKQFSIDWYRFQWECYWFAKQAGQKDSKYKDTAVKFYNRAKSTDDFATLKSHGEEGLLLFKYFTNNR